MNVDGIKYQSCSWHLLASHRLPEVWKRRLEPLEFRSVHVSALSRPCADGCGTGWAQKSEKAMGEVETHGDT